ncbi:MAG: hypothetical protein GY842_06515 [bacterium]|nr:hypothetical protein [bacterium]
MRKVIAILLALASVAALVVGLVSYRGRIIVHQSTDRYCLRWQAEAGRLGLVFDGGLDVLGPLPSPFEAAGIELIDATKFGWRYVTFSVPFAYPVVILGVFPTLCAIRPPLRRWQRRRKGLCLKCGYDLTGNTSGVCPECGNGVRPEHGIL